MLILSSEKKHALLSRMRRRNALRHSHQTLHLQKLRLISDTTRTLGTARKTKTKNGNRRRRKTKRKKRIPKMVAKQKKITAQLQPFMRLVSKQYKERSQSFLSNHLAAKRERNDQRHGDNLRRQRATDR
jgi:hypothetical protein